MSNPFPQLVKTEFPSKVLEADVRGDGELVAVALFNPNGDQAPIRVLNSNDLSPVSEWGPTNANGRAVCFTHGGTKLHYLVASEENPSALHLHRVDLSTGKDTLVTPYSRRSDDPERLIRNADGSMMAVLGRMAEIWDLTSNEVIQRISLRDGALPSDSMRGAFSFTGPTVFLHGHEAEHVVQVDLLDGKTRARYRAPTDEPGAVAVSPDGKYLSVCGRSGGSAYVYDTERGRIAEDTFDDGMGHWELQFSGDSKGIVFGVFGPTWVDLSDEEEYESDEEVFESRVRVLRKAAAAEVYAFATTDNDLVVATRA